MMRADQQWRAWIVVVFLTTPHVMISVTAAGRPLSHGAHGQAQQSSQAQLINKQGEHGDDEKQEAYGERLMALGTLGSRPPNCERKCGGCRPCEAIQIPTTTDHFGIQYSNYEPEGWKCKCGASFFNP
ncbi:hypothetical protein QJS10_CPB18g00807 [Acorus calamus]|uniref:Epidermal patterning factor-like protein n=1 Tax=Acorus calamus TaxID=4465 RepID=A0AAV9CPC4_ACOCL|nr:hypothetical protein QJS10_CPB18g00807 [Acorus calamus]